MTEYHDILDYSVHTILWQQFKKLTYDCEGQVATQFLLFSVYINQNPDDYYVMIIIMIVPPFLSIYPSVRLSICQFQILVRMRSDILA